MSIPTSFIGGGPKEAFDKCPCVARGGVCDVCHSIRGSAEGCQAEQARRQPDGHGLSVRELRRRQWRQWRWDPAASEESRKEAARQGYRFRRSAREKQATRSISFAGTSGKIAAASPSKRKFGNTASERCGGGRQPVSGCQLSHTTGTATGAQGPQQDPQEQGGRRCRRDLKSGRNFVSGWRKDARCWKGPSCHEEVTKAQEAQPIEICSTLHSRCGGAAGCNRQFCLQAHGLHTSTSVG